MKARHYLLTPNKCFCQEECPWGPVTTASPDSIHFTPVQITRRYQAVNAKLWSLTERVQEK